MNITQLLKSLFISIGFISTIQLGFTPITITQNNSEYSFFTELEGAITNDIDELLHSGTDIGITFLTTIYSENKKWTFTDNKSLSYISLTDEYKLLNNAETITISRDKESIYEKFITVNHTFNRDFSLVVIRAELNIPDIKDESIIASLWGNVSPRASYKQEENSR